MTTAATIGAAFREGFVEADGFRIRYLEAGSGEPLVALHGAGGLALNRTYDLLAEKHRVIAFETPGFGASAVNERSQSMKDLARTMAQAAANLGLERYSLMGTSFGGRLALWQAALAPEPLDALVLVAPAAVLTEDWVAPPTPEAQLRAAWAHPERRPEAPPPDPEISAKQWGFINRIRGLAKDDELEAVLPGVNVPTLVLFGTQDGIVSPELGRVYREKMPNCNFVLVYDAAHAMVSERPEAVASVAGDFLERKEAFVVSNQSTMINP